MGMGQKYQVVGNLIHHCLRMHSESKEFEEVDRIIVGVHGEVFVSGHVVSARELFEKKLES